MNDTMPASGWTELWELEGDHIVPSKLGMDAFTTYHPSESTDHLYVSGRRAEVVEEYKRDLP